MNTVHLRDREYSSAEKVAAAISYLRTGKLGPIGYHALGLDPWKRPLDATRPVIIEAIITLLSVLVPQNLEQ